MKNTREGYIPVRGGRLWYSISGDDVDAVPLLALHGGPGASHDFLEPLENLGDERPVILYDQLGCGNSDRPEDKSLWTIERFSEEIDTVRAHLNLKTIHLLGYSWGTMLAVDYMLKTRPEGVRSLVLSAPCLSAKRWARDQKAYLSRMPREIQDAIDKAEKSGSFDSPEYQNAMMEYYKIHLCRFDPWPDAVNKTFEKMNLSLYGHMWGPSEFSVTGTLKNYERAEQLGELQMPVLFTCGSYDEATPETTEYYHNMLPGSEIVIFENASHLHINEKTKEYLAAIRQFLNKLT